MTDDNDVYTTAQHREHIEGYGQRSPVEHPHTGIVRDEQVSRYLSVMQEFYDPASQGGKMPGRVEELEEYRQITGIEATETGRQALEHGDMPTLKHLTGDTNEQADISGMKAIQKIDQIIESPAPVIVILGEMGSGKTDLGGLFGQRATHLLGVEKVASNIPTLKEVDSWTDEDGDERSGFVGGYATFEEWVRQDGDPLENDQQTKLFIGDEFSSVGSGTGKEGYMMRQRMGPLVFKIRKYDGMLIYIAHDESSIHPLLWRVGVVVKKLSTKKAVVADKIKNGEVRDKRFEIQGIPPTDWRYNTKDPAVWSWTESEDDDLPEPGEVAYDVALWTVRECKKDGLSHRDTAKYIPFSKSWVGDRWPEIEAGEHREALDTVEAITT